MKMTRRSFVQWTAALGGAGHIPLKAKGAGPRAARQQAPWALSEEFLARLPTLLELANVPGLAVAIINEGKVAWTQGFGVKKNGSPETVTPATVFGAASLSKPVMAYAAFQLVDEKGLELDRPLFQYLPAPDLPDDPRTRQITARHVLSHSTGWQNWRFNREDTLRFAFDPGTRFSYSGEGYFLLQRVIEKITGHGFEAQMRERVFKPLGMEQSSYVWLPSYDSLLATGHNVRGISSPAWNAQQAPKLLALAEKQGKPLLSWKYEDLAAALRETNPEIPVFPNFIIPNCAGSLITSVSDYARFMTRLLTQSPRDAASLSDASRQAMLTPQVKLNSELSWGLGWGLEAEAGRTCFWHWGDNGNFKAFALGDPAARRGIVVLTNAANGHRLWQRIVAQATGRDHAAFLFWMT